MIKWLLTFILLFPATVFAETCYLGQWEWYDESTAPDPVDLQYWRAPGGDHTGLFDLRVYTDMTPKGGAPEGYGVFCYATPQTHPLLLEELFSDPDEAVPNNVRNRVRQFLGIQTVNGATWRELLWDLLTIQADPTGIDRWRPLRPGSDGKMRFKLGNFGVIKEAKITEESPEWPNALAAIQDIYRTKIEQGEDHTVIAKWLDYQEHLYDIPYHKFIPDDARIKLASLPHETSIDINFNCTDSSTLDCNGYTWTEFNVDFQIETNEINIITDSTTADGEARVDTALSSDGQTSQIDITDSAFSATSYGAIFGTMLRKDSSATRDAYVCWYVSSSFSTQTVRFYKLAGGTYSNLTTGSDLTGSGDPLAGEIRCEIDASDNYEVWWDDVSEVTGSDTTYQGDLYVGVLGRKTSTNRHGGGDNFYAADLAAAAARRVIVISKKEDAE